MQLLKDVNALYGTALVMVTHSEAHAAYASRIVRMEDDLITEGRV